MSAQNPSEDFNELAKSLLRKTSITKQEFIQLCSLAVSQIDNGETTLQSRSDMAYSIAGLWLRHDNISDGSITSDIGGQFAEWEIPGTFTIDDDLHRPYWIDLKKWIADAERKYEKKNG